MHLNYMLSALVAIYLSRCSNGLRGADEIPKRFIGNGKCRVVITEINLFPLGFQFIELMRVCTPEPKNVFNIATDKKYKLAFIDHSGFLVGVCELRNEGYRRNGQFVFYVVGGRAIQEKDMSISDCDFARDSDYYENGYLPYAAKAPVMVALVFHPKARLQWLNLKKEAGSFYKVPMTKSMQSLIIPYIVDSYVYTSSSPYTGCDHFATYYNGYARENNVILRDWAHDADDLSLNRCNPDGLNPEVEWDPMKPEYWSYGPKSIGDVNLCSKARKFRIEEMQPPRIPPIAHYRTTPEYSCYITTQDSHIDAANMITSPLNYMLALRELFNDVLQPTVTAATSAQRDVAQATPTPAQEPLDDASFQARLAAGVPHIWKSCQKFGFTEWIKSLRNQKTTYIRSQDVLREDVCFWFEYVEADQFQCRLCRTLHAQQIIFDRPGSPQMKGVKKPRAFRKANSKSTPYKNRRLLISHMESDVHKMALDFFGLFDQGLRDEELKAEFQREGGPLSNFIQQTCNELVAVYQSRRLDLPFYKHSLTIDLLKYYDVKVGYLYHNPSGDKVITMSISKTMHIDYVKGLLLLKPELSILVDTATDVQSIASLAVIFMTLDENKEVNLKLYRLIKCGKDETADRMMSLLMEAFKEDGIQEYVKEKLVGFASDGGSNVMKLRRLLQTWTGRQNLYLVHCYAHRLDLVLDTSWGLIPYLQDIDRLVNNEHSLFESRSNKKKEMLHRITEEEGEKIFEVKRVIPTRWVNSKRRALFAIMAHWKILVRATELVLADKGTTPGQRLTATTSLSQLKDPTFMATLAFVLDNCEHLSVLSLEFQLKGTTLIGKKAKRERFKAKMTASKTENGEWLQWLLDNARIPDEGNRLVASLDEFETKKVTLEGIEMTHNPEDPNRLSLQRENYINTVTEAVDFYFAEDPTDNFDIFDPSLWNLNELQHYGNLALLSTNMGLNWNYPAPQLLQDWISLKTAVAQSADFKKWQKKTPEEFWTYFLKEGSGITWPDSMKSIIKNLLVVPAATAEVERIFAIYKSQKTRRRYSLDVSTIEGIIRLKYNGPKDLKDFDCFHYVKQFILEGHSRGDDPTIRGRKRMREEVSDVDESENEGEVDNEQSSEEEFEFGLEEDEFEEHNHIFIGDEEGFDDNELDEDDFDLED